MGGSASEEFLGTSEVGEDTFVQCLESGYAANVEAVVTPPGDERSIEGLPAAVAHDTGDTGPSRHWSTGPMVHSTAR